MLSRPPIHDAKIVRAIGELPFWVVINGSIWGMHRTDADAVRYMGQVCGIQGLSVKGVGVAKGLPAW